MRAPDYWQSGPTAAIGHLLSPLGALYAIATSLRASAQPSWKAPVPVICLGNLVMGGAGKTPEICPICYTLLPKGGFCCRVLQRRKR